ncbi:hypothetical protein HLB44_20825 [Aquincola sp. S2]|uniref:3-oxoacyl-ACP synthase n=1 Tax=Pseudaquabacterium terrae TaxID=2732868 RepID=A0ABX2ELH6_9BURK|nr:hypothetical protein [Aquabacterium terrae]NRF69449.1 hypothetical protein [Aquabacterium terrae]
MTKILKHTAMLVAVCCLAWLSVAWHWRTSGHAPSGDELLRYLLLLPLVVFVLLLLLRWAWRSAAVRAPVGAAAGATSAATGAAAAPATGNAANETPPPLQLLAAHLRCAAAEAPADLVKAAQANQPLPLLDPQLRNADGLPVMSLRIAQLPLDELKESLPTHADDAAPPEHLQRALAALHDPLAAALQAIAPWRNRFADPDADLDIAASGLPTEPAATANWPRLQVLLAWPAAWTDAERALADTWAREQCHAGPIEPSQLRIESTTLGGAELWLDIERRLQRRDPQAPAAPLLVAAAHSDLSDEAIAALEHQRRLFNAASHPKGLMPAESAAALLLAPHDWPAAAEGDEPPLQLHRAAALRRDKSIEAAGSVSSQTLIDVLGGALTLAKLPPTELTQLVCDADRHSQRGTELFGATLKLLPQLDPAEHLAMTGSVAGHGGATPLMVIAAAAAQARTERQPCLALSLGDTHWRFALLARAPAAS